MSILKQWLLTLVLASMWSPSFLFIKLAVQDLPPFTIVWLRVMIGGLLLIVLLMWQRQIFPREVRFWWHSFIMSLFASAIPFCLFCYAEQSIESAVAAVINGCSPMFTALLAHYLIASDRMSMQKGIGIALCAAGLLLLFAPDLARGVNATALGMLAAIGATLCYSISHIYAKKYLMGNRGLVTPTAQMITSTLIVMPFALWIDHPWSLPMPSWSAIAGVLGLACFGTASAFYIYYKLLAHCGPTSISMVTCFFPIGGMMLGYLFLGETLSIEGLAACALILLGMMIVNGVIRIPVLSKASL